VYGRLGASDRVIGDHPAHRQAVQRPFEGRPLVL
jgi:hypothetical protein